MHHRTELLLEAFARSHNAGPSTSKGIPGIVYNMKTHISCALPDSRQNIQYVVAASDLESILRELINELLNSREEAKKETYVSSSKASAMLGVSKSTLWRWEKEKYLIPTRIGNKLRYRESDIINLMEGTSHE